MSDENFIHKVRRDSHEWTSAISWEVRRFLIENCDLPLKVVYDRVFKIGKLDKGITSFEFEEILEGNCNDLDVLAAVTIAAGGDFGKRLASAIDTMEDVKRETKGERT
jgi:hypothetical protein